MASSSVMPIYRTGVNINELPDTGSDLQEEQEEFTYITVELQKYNEGFYGSNYRRIDICLDEVVTEEDSLVLKLKETLTELDVAPVGHDVIIAELFEHIRKRVILGRTVSVMVEMSIIDVTRPWLMELNDHSEALSDEEDDFDAMEVEFLEETTATVKTTPASEAAIAGLHKFLCHGLLCVICTEVGDGMEKCARMPCAHEFHENCLFTWLRTSNYCPLCRFQLAC